MDHFRIPQKVLFNWLWEEKNTKKSMVKIIMENIRDRFNHSDKELQQIEKKIKQTFIPHFKRLCTKFRWRKDYMEKKSQVFFSNEFTVKFKN